MTLEKIRESLGERGGGRPWLIRERSAPAFEPLMYFLGKGEQPLEVAYALFPRSDSPRVADVRDLWIARQDYRPSPLLLIILYKDAGDPRAALCGPIGESPRVLVDMDPHQATRLADAALEQPNAQEACRYVLAALPETESQLPGIRNEGLFATHELATDVPNRADWNEAAAQGRAVLKERGRKLIEALGFTIEQKGASTHVLRVKQDDSARAVAVFLEQTEPFEQSSARFPDSPPISVALARAETENLPYVVITRGDRIRIYSTRKDVGVGRKGRSETFVEANLTLLPDRFAGYIPLIFGARALAANGSFEEILEKSRDFASDLGARLRERVYERVVPQLAEAIARREIDSGEQATDEQLRHIYEMAMTLLFRLLFIAYAEDTGLLPYRENEVYRRHALKTKARELADRANRDGVDVPDFDETQTDLWDELRSLWSAVDKGNADWGVPPYNGGLFTSDPDHGPIGAALAELRLANDDIGPALFALLVDTAETDTHGPVDFRALSVREFGTIYEGLLESSLAVAPNDLTLDADRRYVPAVRGDDIEVRKGEVYLQNRSGVRKSTGTYYTKHFAVEHLLDHALEPAVDDHLTRLVALLQKGEEAAASRAFFDFRCADIAMGSGHFLVAAVDHIEARLSSFLAEHPMPHVTAELERLRQAALERLGPLAEGREIELSTLLRRQVARRCIYGVDLNPIAVELARLAIWIHTFVPGLPLSFLDHNLVHGNSLTGIGTLEEAVDEIEPRAAEGPSLFREEILGWLRKAEKALQRLGTTAEASAREVKEAENAHRDALAAVEPVQDLFDLLVAARLTSGLRDGDAGKILRPAAVSETGVTRHPKLSMARKLSYDVGALHFPVRFPEVFLRAGSGFDCIIGNPPWEEATVEEDKFWRRHAPSLRFMETDAAARSIERLRSERPDLEAEYQAEVLKAAHLRQALLSGPYPGMGEGDPDLYKAFTWRFAALVRKGGRLGLVLPRSVFATKGSAEWRKHFLRGSQAELVLCRNEKEWLFTDVNPGYSVALFSALNHAEHQAEVRISGTFTNLATFLERADEFAVLSIAKLAAVDPLLCIPAIEGSAEFALFDRIVSHPPFGSEDRDDWRARPDTDLHATNDKGRFTPSGHPIYNHKNVGHLRFDPSEGEFARTDFENTARYLDSKRRRAARSTRSPMFEMPREWVLDPSTLPPRNPRLVFRDVVHASNARKIWFCLAPSNSLFTNAAPYLLFPRGGTVDQAYVLGIMASSVADWFGHLRVVLHLNYFILNSIPVPLFDRGPIGNRVAALAAKLAVSDEGDYGEWRGIADAVESIEPTEAMTELDALVSILYGVTDEQVPLIWPESPSEVRPALGPVMEHRKRWARIVP